MIKDLTKNRMDNLIVYRILISEWYIQSLDYIKEKYYVLFNDVPDKIIVGWASGKSVMLSGTRDEMMDFQRIYETYIRRWNMMRELEEDDIKILFFTYLLSNLYRFDFDNVKNVYKQSFTNLKFMNDENYVFLLHANFRGHVDDFYKYNKIVNRILKITKINHIIVNK